MQIGWHKGGAGTTMQNRLVEYLGSDLVWQMQLKLKNNLLNMWASWYTKKSYIDILLSIL